MIMIRNSEKTSHAEGTEGTEEFGEVLRSLRSLCVSSRSFRRIWNDTRSDLKTKFRHQLPLVAEFVVSELSCDSGLGRAVPLLSSLQPGPPFTDRNRVDDVPRQSSASPP